MEVLFICGYKVVGGDENMERRVLLTQMFGVEEFP